MASSEAVRMRVDAEDDAGRDQQPDDGSPADDGSNDGDDHRRCTGGILVACPSACARRR